MALDVQFASVFVLAALSVWAQEPPAGTPQSVPTLENTGKPILVPLQCSEDDIRGAGLSCSEDEPCPVYLELTAVASPGSRILAAGNLHTESVTLYSILLASEDGGHNWTEVHERVRAANLEHIQFQDAERGWIGGQEVSPLPQNPFILSTSDGGKTWRRHPVFSDSAESRFGTVQQFHFTSKDDGSLIVDRGQGSEGGRYARYESNDGGDTWNIKEESTRPLTLKAPPAPAPEWRLRVDAASRSYHIEHRQGDRWSNVAAFLVKLDPCKPPKPVEPGKLE